MNKPAVKRLIGPVIIFSAFILVAFFTEDVLKQFGIEAMYQSQQVLDYGLKVGLWFSTAFLINRLLLVFFWDGLVSKTVNGQVPRLLKDITGATLYIIAAMGVVAVVFEKDITGFWATSGVMGIVLGIALRNIILDLFTGLAVNVDRPYSIGDWIMIVDDPGGTDNLIGCVDEVNWRTTRLKTTDNNLLIVPNNVMGQKVITNFMNPGEQSRFELKFTLDFSVPSERAIRVLNAAVKAVAGEELGPLPNPAPKARITGITEQGVQYRVRYWLVPRLVSPAKARHTVITSVLDHLHQAGLTLAYPKQDTYWAPMPKRQYEPELLGDRQELLKRIAWFAALTADEIKQVGEALLPRRFSQGATLMAEGEVGDSMFVVVEGLAEMMAHSPEVQQDVKIGKLVPGDFYGEMSLLTGEQRPATIRAVTDVVAYELRKEHMAPLLESRPEVAEAISAIVARRQVAAEQALAEVGTPEKEERTQTLAASICEKMRNFFSGAIGGADRLIGAPIRERFSSSV